MPSSFSLFCRQKAHATMGRNELDGMKFVSPELRLILACARIVTTQKVETSIREILAEGVDWTLFARKALAHGLAGLAGHTLARVASDMVPHDILTALNVVIVQTRKGNEALFDELARVIDGLAKKGIDAIPLKGPVLAIQAFGDLGLRSFRDLDFLVRDSDLAASIEILRSFGYERNGPLTAAQFDLIHRLQGQEILFKQTVGTALEPHTRLTPIKMALDIDYAGLWRRAQPSDLNGRSMLTLAPEDEFITLAIHGGKESWWNIKWACDTAAFIASHPKLDWPAIVERARAQGCFRMVLLATSLARQCFGTTIPGPLLDAERANPTIGSMAGRIIEHWHSDDISGPPSNKTLSMDRLRLHDGIIRQMHYVLRTLFLPGPQHVPLIALPSSLSFAYVPIKMAHDMIALPLWLAYRKASAQVRRVGDVIARSGLAYAVLPASSETKLIIGRHQRRAPTQQAF